MELIQCCLCIWPLFMQDCGIRREQSKTSPALGPGPRSSWRWQGGLGVKDSSPVTCTLPHFISNWKLLTKDAGVSVWSWWCLLVKLESSPWVRWMVARHMLFPSFFVFLAFCIALAREAKMRSDAQESYLFLWTHQWSVCQPGKVSLFPLVWKPYHAWKFWSCFCCLQSA